MKLTEDQIREIEIRHNVYVADGQYNRGNANAIYGWLPLPEDWTAEVQRFYRVDDNGNAQIFEGDGSVATRIQGDGCQTIVYPVAPTVVTGLSVEYEHPEGITLTQADAEMLGIREE